MERSGSRLPGDGRLLYLLRTLPPFGQSEADRGCRPGHGEGRAALRWRVTAATLLFVCTGLGLPARGQVRRPVASEEEFSTSLKEGFALHQRADFAGALPMLERARRLRPHDYFANLLVGIDLLRTGRAAASIVPLAEASRREPKEDIPLAYLGEAQARGGHFAEAAEAYARAVEVGAGSSQAGSSQTVESAISFSMERFRTLSGELRETSRGLAADYRLQAMAQAVDSPKRTQMLMDSAALDPDARGIWSELAIAGAAEGREPEARAWLARATTADRNDLRARLAQALVAARGGDWALSSSELGEVAEHSRGALRRAVPEWPRTLEPAAEGEVTGVARSFLGCVQAAAVVCELGGMDGVGARTVRVAAGGEASAGHAAGAGASHAAGAAGVLFREQRWEQVAGLAAPAAGDARGWLWRGVALAHTGRWSAAIPALERALAGPGRVKAGGSGAVPVRGVRVDTGDRVDGVYAQFLLCWAYAQEAAEMLRLLERETGDAASVHLIRGDVLLRMQGSNTAAIAEYRAGLGARGDDPTLLERLAEAQFADRQPEAAAESARAALRIDPQRFTAMRTLARVAMEQRDYGAALPYLLQLAAHSPEDAPVQVELGTAYAETGDSRGALEHLGPPLARGYPDERGSLHAMLGTVLRKLGRTEESARAFAQARALSELYQSRPNGSSDEQR